MSQAFAKKTVVITGASAGVGAACARAFANEGANLVLAARGQAALNAIDNELYSKRRTECVSRGKVRGLSHVTRTLLQKGIRYEKWIYRR